MSEFGQREREKERNPIIIILKITRKAINEINMKYTIEHWWPHNSARQMNSPRFIESISQFTNRMWVCEWKILMIIQKCCCHIIYCLALNTFIWMWPDCFSDLIATMSLSLWLEQWELNHMSIVLFSCEIH